MFVTSHRVVPLVLMPVALLGAVVGTRQARGDECEPPVISTTIDFLDYCFSRTDPPTGYFTEEHYDEVIRTIDEVQV